MADAAVERLLDSLLWEGYALYPYTPGATKNATPTPFGIVYPPTYAAGATTTFDHLELRCALDARADAEIDAEVAFLIATGERHQGEAHRVRLGRSRVRELLRGALEVERELGADRGSGVVMGVRMSAHEREHGRVEICVRVENRTPCEPAVDRAGALARSLLSVHPIVTVRGGRFISPLERLCESVNTFPVLASAHDDCVLGASIILPDHPQIAPESRGGLFDSTEIEEALLLHVHALSDGERAEIERQDPAVREMVARAAAATPQDIIALHGRVTLRDPEPPRAAFSGTPPAEPEGLLDPREGEREVEVEGVLFRRGARVRICPGPDADLHARMLDGRTATIERILVDYDGKTHLGVTIDGDPGQDLMRESGRLLFFFAPEVEVVDAPEAPARELRGPNGALAGGGGEVARG
jgi:hypothetical protein